MTENKTKPTEQKIMLRSYFDIKKFLDKGSLNNLSKADLLYLLNSIYSQQDSNYIDIWLYKRDLPYRLEKEEELFNILRRNFTKKNLQDLYNALTTSGITDLTKSAYPSTKNMDIIADYYTLFEENDYYNTNFRKIFHQFFRFLFQEIDQDMIKETQNLKKESEKILQKRAEQEEIEKQKRAEQEEIEKQKRAEQKEIEEQKRAEQQKIEKQEQKEYATKLITSIKEGKTYNIPKTFKYKNGKVDDFSTFAKQVVSKDDLLEAYKKILDAQNQVNTLTELKHYNSTLNTLDKMNISKKYCRSFLKPDFFTKVAKLLNISVEEIKMSKPAGKDSASIRRYNEVCKIKNQFDALFAPTYPTYYDNELERKRREFNKRNQFSRAIRIIAPNELPKPMKKLESKVADIIYRSKKQK